MGNLGLGVMINMLSGNEKTVKAIKEATGKTITKASMVDDTLIIETGDQTLKVWDSGQSCCEARYMTTDDELTYYEGARLMGFEVADGPEGDGGEVHEQQFLKVTTSKGVFTVVTHNEHNGYYGGFCLAASMEK